MKPYFSEVHLQTFHLRHRSSHMPTSCTSCHNRIHQVLPGEKYSFKCATKSFRICLSWLSTQFFFLLIFQDQNSFAPRNSKALRALKILEKVLTNCKEQSATVSLRVGVLFLLCLYRMSRLRSRCVYAFLEKKSF